MKCPNCGGRMVRRSCYEWSEEYGKNVLVYYYVCVDCTHVSYER